MNNVKNYIIIIAVSLLIGFGVSYAWNNQTLSEMVEEHNQQILSDCLTKARIQKTAKEILEYASNCNKDILTNLSTPRSVETITGTGDIITKEEQECIKNTKDGWSEDPEMIEQIRKCTRKFGTHSTGNTVQPLGFQLIPQASAKEHTTVNVGIAVGTGSEQDEIIHITEKIRTPKQIYEQVNCNIECKIETITKLGINSNIAKLIVLECKEGAIDPVHCIKVASSIIINESGGGKSNACKTRFNCMGIGSGKVSYTSYQEAIANWVSKYNRYWFKAKDMSFFYATTGNIPPSRYCMSEDSSGSDLGCPTGLRIANGIFSKLNKLF